MLAYRLETVIPPNGELQLKALPFRPREAIEVIILMRTPTSTNQALFPLQGSVLKFEDPTEPVAVDDWDVLQ
ncbi:MAG: hypothetical protein DYG89_17980 [Caldilinea sp. CFX5]|nr:hypothetical protein [Caldilinea sp. CFX5]